MTRPPFSIRLTLLLVSSLTVMSGATIAPALPPMAAHLATLGVEAADFWTRVILTAPAIGIVLTASAAGALGDRFGRVPPMLVAAALYALAGSAGLWVDGLAGLVASRIALGLAVAILMTGATAMIGDTFTGHARASFMGIQASFMGFGGVVFLTLGGALADIHWRGPFLIYLSSLIVLVLIALRLRDAAPHRGTGARDEAKIPEAPAQEDGGTPPDIAPWRLYALAVLVFATFYQTPTQMPFRLEALGVDDRTLAGLVVATLPFVAATSALFYGRVKARLSYSHVMAVGFAIVGVAYVGVALSHSVAAAWAWMAIGGIGLGWTMPNLSVWLLAVVPEHRRGQAIGGLTSGVFIGQFIAPLAAQPAVALAGPSGAFAAAAGVLAIASALLFRHGHIRNRCRPTANRDAT